MGSAGVHSGDSKAESHPHSMQLLGGDFFFGASPRASKSGDHESLWSLGDLVGRQLLHSSLLCGLSSAQVVRESQAVVAVWAFTHQALTIG